uniref:Kinesin motor domain-containing protein n=1 Tax=Parascaris equorum TaxID=6256 RepID=A0A914RH39_PAREQ
MLGPPGGQDVIDEQPHLRGLIPRSVEHLFRELDEKSEKVVERTLNVMFEQAAVLRELGSTFTYQLKCTFSQLYNENFYDLLSTDSRRVTPRPNKNGIMYLAGATERVVLSTADVIQVCFQLFNLKSILNLVDLAGSERQRDTEATSKTRVKVMA